MKIDIDRLGLKNVTVDPDTLFTFPNGMAGFEACKRFKLFHEEGGGTVFWLQSVDDTSVMFPIVVPDKIDVEYEIELSDADCALIDLQDASDVAIVVIVYRDEAEGGQLRIQPGQCGIGQRVHPHIGIRMPQQAVAMGHGHTAQQQGAAGDEGMHIPAFANA